MIEEEITRRHKLDGGEETFKSTFFSYFSIQGNGLSDNKCQFKEQCV